MNPRNLLPIAFLLSSCAREPKAATAPNVELVTLDCGRIDVKDMGFFSETGAPTGQPGILVVPCYVVRHPRGILLWETGLTDAFVGHPGADPVGNRESVEMPLRARLASIGLSPADITFVAFSHLHADHAGNANQFSASTWLMDRRELAWASADPTPLGVDATTFSAFRTAKVRLLDDDEDVFGDGTVRMIRTPGHTPGHRSLVLSLAKAGTVVLSGDLAHTRENWERGLVPHFNTDREATRVSMARAHSFGRVIVEHAPEDFAALPTAPAALK